MTTILVVEDEENQRILYEKKLSMEGYDVLLARNGYEALEKVKKEKPDLVVLDMKMPGMDGIETLGKMLAEDEDLPVIINTAYDVWKEDFRSRLAEAYVIKSPDLKQLTETIQQVLKKKQKAH